MTGVSLTPPPAARPCPPSLTSPPSPTSPTRLARVGSRVPAYPSALCSWPDDCDLLFLGPAEPLLLPPI